jgi:hypothetical protein
LAATYLALFTDIQYYIYEPDTENRLVAAQKTVLDLEQHLQRLEAQLEDEMHRKQLSKHN